MAFDTGWFCSSSRCLGLTELSGAGAAVAGVVGVYGEIRSSCVSRTWICEAVSEGFLAGDGEEGLTTLWIPRSLLPPDRG